MALASCSQSDVPKESTKDSESVENVIMARRSIRQYTKQTISRDTLDQIIKCGINAKMAPPLREESDREALVEALRAGVVTCVATDHAPHTAQEKAQGWLKAPFGITGVETVVPLLLTYLVKPGIIDLPCFVSLFTKGPRNLLGINRGTLAIGEPADLTILDLQAEYTIQAELLHSKSFNCPWLGWHVAGKVVGIIRSSLEIVFQ